MNSLLKATLKKFRQQRQSEGLRSIQTSFRMEEQGRV
jgi:hypothetical protein